MGTDAAGDDQPLKLPFGFGRRRRPRTADGGRLLLERRRKGSDTWVSEGEFASRSAAKRAARTRGRKDLGAEFRIRPAPEPG